MADEKKDIPVDSDNSDAPVAEMHMSQIIAALHLNAIAHCKGDLGDKFRIVNSAVDESGNKAVLTSQGEHIVSVIPTEKTAAEVSKDVLEIVPKETAVKILQTYVQWFVGPDLANKVTDKTVISLNDAPASNSNTKEVQKNDAHDLYDNESIKPFMKFSQFLREAESSEGSEGSESHEGESSSGETSSGETPAPPSEPSEKTPKDDITKKQQGYYITYELKVEGLKKVKLNTARRAIVKSIFNYIGNFFDDVTFTARGLFGGGQSFKVKDVKDKIHQTFGSIDPDELARNVQDRLDKKFKGSSPGAIVKIQDKRTLLADLGNAVSGKDRKRIEKANYSLTIRIDQDDPKRDILNKAMVADIVTASIQGLWKKFRNRIGTNQVIYIENYKDIHGSTERIRKLYHNVPSPNRIREQIRKSRNVNDAISKIEKILQRVSGDRDRDDCPRAEECWNAWLNFAKAKDIKKKTDELDKIDNGSQQFNRFFQPLIDAYSKAYERTEDTSLNESKMFVVSCESLKKDMLQMMFESYLYEDESAEDDKEKVDLGKLDTRFIVGRCINLINKHDIFGSKVSQSNVLCITKDDIKKKLKDFYISSFDTDFGEFKNGILICQKSDILSESSSSTSGLKNAIMDILFEEDTPAGGDETKGHKIDVNRLYTALKKALSEFGIDDIGDKILTYELKELDDELDSEEDSSSEDGEESDVSESIHSLNDMMLLEGKLADFIRDNHLSKDDALKDENIDELKAIIKQGPDETRRRVIKYFEKISSDASDTEKPDTEKPDTEKPDTERPETATEENENVAYVLPFGKDGEIKPPPSEKLPDDNAEISNYGHRQNDLYIVPIPKLKQDDPEYANKALV